MSLCDHGLTRCPKCDIKPGYTALEVTIRRMKNGSIPNATDVAAVEAVLDAYEIQLTLKEGISEANEELRKENRRLHDALEWAISDEGMNIIYSVNGPKKYFSELRRRYLPDDRR
jgi:hypothetical protein